MTTATEPKKQKIRCAYDTTAKRMTVDLYERQRTVLQDALSLVSDLEAMGAVKSGLSLAAVIAELKLSE